MAAASVLAVLGAGVAQAGQLSSAPAVLVRFSTHIPAPTAVTVGPYELAAVSQERRIGEGDAVIWGETAGKRTVLATWPEGAEGWSVPGSPLAWDTVRFETTDTLNASGSVYFAVDATVEGEPRLVVKLSAGATMPTDQNNFGARGTEVSHDYYTLTAAQATDLVTGLRAWLEHPVPDVAYSLPGDPAGLSFIGSVNMNNRSIPPVLVAQMPAWLDVGPYHHHGSSYAVLSVAETQILADSIGAWISKPYAGSVFEKLIQ